MMIELVDSLRCPRDHEESWLVAVVAERDGPHIVRGTLGCPVCDAEFPIVDRVARFDGGRDVRDLGAIAGRPDSAAVAERAMRAAAMLGLSEGGGLVVLAGDWCTVAPLLLEIAPVHLLLVDPRTDSPAIDGVSVMRTAARLPLAASTLRAAALDARTGSGTMVASVVRALQARGRLVLDASIAAPSEIAELARDAEHFVGERAPMPAPSAPVRLMRARRDDATT